jgi:hypothetical protein
MLKPPTALTVMDAGPLPEGILSPLADALHRARFVACGPRDRARSGWTLVDDPSGEGVDDSSRWWHAPWILLQFRSDEKKIPAAVVKLRLDAEVKTWCTQAGRERCPPKVREELQETIELELLHGIPATPTLVLVAYHAVTGRLYVGSKDEQLLDKIGRAFHAWTGLRATPWQVGDVARAWPEAFAELCGAEPDPDRAATWSPGTRGQMLRWLWWRSESSEGQLPSTDQKTEWMAIDGIAILDEDTGKVRMNVKAEDAVSDPAVKVALLDGHAVASVGLSLRLDGVPLYDVALECKGGEVRIQRIALPKPAATTDAEIALECAVWLEDLHDRVAELGEAFVLVRGWSEQWGEAEAMYQGWLERELRGWTERKGLVAAERDRGAA